LTNTSNVTVTIDVDATGRGLLALSDTFYPGWTATIDGQETPILRANGVMRAIVVETGRHTVNFHFLPGSFRSGAIVSTIAFGTPAIVLLVSSLRRRLSHAQRGALPTSL
jgi:uncharacterized membrane protein YfhO